MFSICGSRRPTRDLRWDMASQRLNTGFQRHHSGSRPWKMHIPVDGSLLRHVGPDAVCGEYRLRDDELKMSDVRVRRGVLSTGGSRRSASGIVRRRSELSPSVELFLQHESIGRSMSDRRRAMPSVRGTSLITSSAGTPIYVPIIPTPPPTTTKHAPPPPLHDMRMLRLYSKQDYTRLPRDKWGIPDAGESRADVEDVKREDCTSERCEFWERR